MNVTDERQTTDGRAIAYSDREREFTFANNGPPFPLTRNPAIAEGPRDAGVPVEIW